MIIKEYSSVVNYRFEESWPFNSDPTNICTQESSASLIYMSRCDIKLPMNLIILHFYSTMVACQAAIPVYLGTYPAAYGEIWEQVLEHYLDVQAENQYETLKG